VASPERAASPPGPAVGAGGADIVWAVPVRLILPAILLAMALAGCGKTLTVTVVTRTAGAQAPSPRGPTQGRSRMYRVPSVSMEPTLKSGAIVAVRGGVAGLGDIVIFHPPEGALQRECGPRPHTVKPGGEACSQPVPEEARVSFIKRIVAGPGEEIYVAEGHVYHRRGAQGSFVREQDPYIKACEGQPECNFPKPITVPAGDWFLMGDNRGQSDDSRFYGPVPSSWITGVVAASTRGEATEAANGRTL
jgi:signal peptidase I